MDIQKLRTQIFEKTGIRVDTVDPIFTLVALNEAMFEHYIASLNEAQSGVKDEIDERIGKLVALQRSIIVASDTLVERAGHAHKSAALKAAADARSAIIEETQNVMHAEVKQALALISTASKELADTSKAISEQNSKRLFTAFVQAVIGGIVAGSTVLIYMHYVQ